MRRFSSRGNLLRFELPGVKRDIRGRPTFGWQRIPLSKFTAYDPNSRKSGSDSDGGDGVGISFGLTGGWSATDPFDGTYWVAPIPLLGGGRLGSLVGRRVSIPIRLRVRTEPGISSDTVVALGVANEAADSGTIGALLNGWRYSAGNRTAMTAVIAAGVSSLTFGGGANNDIRGFDATYSKVGSGTTDLIGTRDGRTTNATEGTLGAFGGVAHVAANFGDSQPYLVLAAWRSATTAGTESPAYDVYVGPVVPVAY